MSNSDIRSKFCHFLHAFLLFCSFFLRLSCFTFLTSASLSLFPSCPFVYYAFHTFLFSFVYPQYTFVLIVAYSTFPAQIFSFPSYIHYMHWRRRNHILARWNCKCHVLKVEVMLPFCLTNLALHHGGVWGSGCIGTRFLDQGTSWR
jgi:hypothetical protein